MTDKIPGLVLRPIHRFAVQIAGVGFGSAAQFLRKDSARVARTWILRPSPRRSVGSIPAGRFGTRSARAIINDGSRR